MWMMTPLGFYSVVRAHANGYVMVRARSKGDLENLRKRMRVTAPIITSRVADYPYRLVVRPKVWARIASQFAMEAVRYRNFKDRVADVNPDRADLYHEVWALLRRIEQEEPCIITRTQSKSQLRQLTAQGAPDPERRR